MRPHLTDTARSDMADIYSYIAEDNVAIADKVLDELFNTFDLLANNSFLGRSRDEIILGLRSFPYRKYIILYRPVDSGIEVVRVLHSARDLDSIFN